MKNVRLSFAVLLALFSNAYAAEPEFDGQCAMGMSEGRKMATDCSIAWVAPDDKLYCFHNPAAKEHFLKSPKEYLTRAQAFWEDPKTLKRPTHRE